MNLEYEQRTEQSKAIKKTDHSSNSYHVSIENSQNIALVTQFD